MSLRLRLAVLTSAGLIAAIYTAALAFNPLCSVFRSARHHSNRAVAHVISASASPALSATPAIPASSASSGSSAATPTELAAHH